VTGLAGADDVIGDLAFDPRSDVGELDLDRDPDVCSRRRATSAAEAEATTSPEEGLEDVVDRAEAGAGSKPPERRPSWPWAS